MMKLTKLVMTAFMALALCSPAMAKMEVKYGHVAPPFHGQNMAVEHFAKYVHEKTGGEIEVKNFPILKIG